MSRLTAKREQFCQEMIRSKANQSKAYRAAFETRGMKAKTIHNEASKLMKDPEITARIAELNKPLAEKVQLTREQWLEDGMRLYRADPRKLFDQFGNTVPITELGDDEITLIEGFKFTEEYTKVKKADDGTDAVPTSYTQDYKMTSFKTRHEYVGKILRTVREPAWRQRLTFADNPAMARKEIEQAFTRGDLDADELAILLRSRDLQLKIEEHESFKTRLTILESKLDQLLSQKGQRP